jgi:hypothetical protein
MHSFRASVPGSPWTSLGRERLWIVLEWTVGCRPLAAQPATVMTLEFARTSYTASSITANVGGMGRGGDDHLPQCRQRCR